MRQAKIILEGPQGKRLVEAGKPYRLLPGERIIGSERSKNLQADNKKLEALAEANGIGVGELVTKLTTQFGIPQCARCKRWAKVLDQLRIRDWKVEIVKNVRKPDDNTGLTSLKKEQ